MSDILRDRVVAEARTWIGTPYAAGQDVKGAGVDCAMLCVRVLADSGAFPFVDPRPYNDQFFLHTGEEILLDYFLARGALAQQPRLGDVALFKMGRAYAHAGIVSSLSPLRMIHAMNSYGRAVEEEVSLLPSSLLRDHKPPIFVSVAGD